MCSEVTFRSNSGFECSTSKTKFEMHGLIGLVKSLDCRLMSTRTHKFTDSHWSVAGMLLFMANTARAMDIYKMGMLL